MTDSITLQPAEVLLRELLLSCRQHMRESQVASAFDLQIWIVGGWVRDRLLGIPCQDIDIALSSMTGEQFGDYLTNYFNENKDYYRLRATELGVQDNTFSDFHTTREKLAKSKKLQTAVGKVFGLDLDLVNLRKEVYEVGSRVPKFGTAEEDALRRDATVNALFSSLNTERVADLTGRELDDMATGILRTPIESRQTFMDDTLRVLRFIRLASKLGYEVDEEARRWMKDEKIHAALEETVSRSRIGIECCKMMKTARPRVAFDLLFEANLYGVVFLGLDSRLHQVLRTKLPARDGQPWPSTWPLAYRVLTTLLDDGTDHLSRVVQSERWNDLLWTMAAYAPMAELRCEASKRVAEEAAYALNARREISRLLELSLRNIDSIRAMVSLVNNHTNIPSRSIVGKAIRAWGWKWRLQVIYSLLAEVVHGTATSEPSDTDSFVQDTVMRYNEFVGFVVEQRLGDAYQLKPLLDGRDVMEWFGVSEGGGFVGDALDEVVAWQMDHEEMGKEEAREWLRGQK